MFDALVAATRAGRVLDIGVGDGRMPRLLRPDSRATFIGLDLTDQLRQSPTLNVCADARALPFADATFDVVYSLGVVEHFPETGDALAEHVRVLRPGGMLFFTVPHLSLATVFKYAQFYAKRQFRWTTFEALRGRNLRIETVRRLLAPLPLRIDRLEGCGVRAARDPARRLMKAVLPESWQHPHLYCVARRIERAG